jgi:hypothetical protein
MLSLCKQSLHSAKILHRTLLEPTMLSIGYTLHSVLNSFTGLEELAIYASFFASFGFTFFKP